MVLALFFELSSTFEVLVRHCTNELPEKQQIECQLIGYIVGLIAVNGIGKQHKKQTLNNGVCDLKETDPGLHGYKSCSNVAKKRLINPDFHQFSANHFYKNLMVHAGIYDIHIRKVSEHQINQIYIHRVLNEKKRHSIAEAPPG
jgi:hypothetical protein